MLLAVLMAVGMWLYVQRVLVPYQKTQASMRQSPRGNLSDLYPRWLGARELLLHHRDPYGAGITREIQIGYYGRPLDRNHRDDPKDEQGFAYPVYVVFLLAPTVTVPFSLVHEVFFWSLAVLTGASVVLWLRALGWMPSPIAIILWILLTISCWPAIQGLKLQQLSLLVAALISAAMLALVRRHFLMAGTLLALATIKPQLVFLLVLWLGIWVIGNWRERQRVFWGFAITMLILIGGGEFLLPGWIGEFRRAMKEYYRYTGGGISVLDVMLSPFWGRIAAAFLVAMLLVFLWPNRRTVENTRTFQWSVCFTLTTTLLIIPMFAPYNQLLLLPTLMMAVRASRELWAKGRVSRFFVSITAVSVLWPFFAGTALVLALAFLPGQAVQKAWDLPFYTNFSIPITAYAMLLVSRPLLSSHPNAADAKAFRTLRQAAASE